jgi:PAS domain S-box-containing protein
MTSARLRTVGFLAVPVFAIVGFVLDLTSPLGISDWVWYVIPLLFTFYVGGRSLPCVLAAVLSILLLAGFFFSPPGIDPEWALISRLVGVLVLWVMALMIWHRKRAEEALLLSKQRLALHVEQTPLAVIQWDSDFKVQEWNPAAEKVFGYTREEAVGRHFSFFVSESARPQVETVGLTLMKRGGSQRSTNENIIKDGKTITCEWFNTTLVDPAGKFIGVASLVQDITERRWTEAALRESKDYLEKIINSVGDPMFVKDRQHRLVLVNEAECRLAGRTREELLGKTDYDFFPKKQVDVFWQNDELVFETGQVNVNEETITNAAGELRTIVTKKSRFISPSGQAFIVGVIRDITERKQMEHSLTETLDFNQKIISNAPVGILVFKASGQCVLANEAAARTVNGTVPQLLSQDFRQLDSWRASGMLRVAEEALATGKPQQYETHFVSTFGKKLWLVCHFTPFVRGDEPHLLLLFNDIIGRKQAEEHVREQAALLDKAQDAIFVLDSDDRITYWNNSAERIYGWTAAEAVGKTSIELLFKGVITPQLANTIKTVNERGEWVGELQEYTKDGKTVTVQGRCNLIRDEQDRPKSRLIINTDITEKKNLETQFLRSQRMEGIGALAGGIAHDLNNVLTPLLIAVQVLKEKVTDEDGQKLLQALETNVQRGASLVKQVLAFGRGVTGERIAVNPKHIAREIKQIIHEIFPKSVEFELHSAPDLWTITGDPTQLHQVLLNLCVNARDAMPNGGKLFIHMENVMFDETYAGMNPEAKVGPYVLIKVEDTGTGIPREIQDKIFDPFFTTKEPGKGTGLGLSTTLTIVKSHGGFIHCHSALGKGSTFEIYLPANATLVPVENASAEESRLPRGHNELVLVVDDEEPIRNLAQKVLTRFGYRVLLAADGTEAVSLYAPRQNEIDVVITDMAMPIMDGPATILALKAINSDVKIVSSSGLASDGGMAMAKNAGIQHFIPKPYTAETMLNTLHEVLHGNHAN